MSRAPTDTQAADPHLVVDPTRPSEAIFELARALARLAVAEDVYAAKLAAAAKRNDPS